MATRGRIGIQRTDGTVIASYNHWDSYTGGLGYTLCEHWTNMSKTRSAIDLGNASKWGIVEGTKTDFNDSDSQVHEYQNIYYGRDRGEKDQGPKVYRDEAEYLAEGFNSGEEYIYLLKDTGQKDYLGRHVGEWFYATWIWNESLKDYDPAERFLPLQDKAIEHKISILQDSLRRVA